MRRIDLHMTENDNFPIAVKIIKNAGVIDFFIQNTRQEDRIVLTIFARNGDSQALMDNLQTLLLQEKDWRVTMSDTLASTPELPQRTASSVEHGNDLVREQLYKEAQNDSRISLDFFLLMALSTVVAAIGLNSDSAAAVIGSMVIAPVLGPVMAIGLGTALGDDDLIFKGSFCIGVGLTLSLILAFAIGLILPVDMDSHELTQRARVGLDGIALAIAAGVAAAISRLTGVGAALVGVMVAAALLPSGAAAGLFASEGYWELAARALLLMLLNVIGLLLSAVLVFRIRKITPHRDYQKATARRAVVVSLTGLILLTCAAALLIVFLDLGSTINIE